MFLHIKLVKGKWSQDLQFWLRNGLKLPHQFFVVCFSLQTIVLCMVGKLAGDGSVVVDVSINDI